MIGLNLDGNEIVGAWHIQEMSEWDPEYLNMEVQAFIRIDKNSKGEFRFGLVSGQISGGFEKDTECERFKFTWEGNDEGEYVSGDGWIRAKDDEFAEGEIRFNSGEISLFITTKVKLE
ncbi:MAG: hypothetical protein U9R75_10260 [Candidatus Thermoplasmatota archaeon]|nr:hypothetical protein [Candidatus Thermoplasmatota archaeon]